MRLIALFLWLALPIGGYAAWQTYGTPHMITGYRFVDNDDPYNPYADRTYTSCNYVGWNWQHITLPARAGRCPWVRLSKAADQ